LALYVASEGTGGKMIETYWYSLGEENIY